MSVHVRISRPQVIQLVNCRSKARVDPDASYAREIVLVVAIKRRAVMGGSRWNELNSRQAPTPTGSPIGCLPATTSAVSIMSSNPFSDPQGMDSNPFADPSVQSGLSSHHQLEPSSSYGLGDDEDVDDMRASKSTLGQAQPQQTDMNSRFEDLARRERELAAREQQLTAKAEHMRKVTSTRKPNGRTELTSTCDLIYQHGRNNWPPGPFPLIYHDIDEVRLSTPPPSQDPGH